MFSFRNAGVLILACLLQFPLNAAAWERGDVESFATLPAGNANPEGIAVDTKGNVYVTTFAPTAPAGQLGRLFVFSPNGQLVRQVSIVGSSSALLGLDFHPQTGALLVIDFGAAKVLQVDPVTGASSVFATVTGAAGLNALTFDAQGNVYISDSFQGIIWKTGLGGGAAAVFATDTPAEPVLHPQGIPPFGANGIGFNKAFDTLFVANTANDTIVEIPDGVSNAVLTIHQRRRRFNSQRTTTSGWPTRPMRSGNRQDGKVIKHRRFDGIDKHGALIGLLFPASPCFRRWLDITNPSLDCAT
jgi:sugar lactone lactonase YvrE